MVYHFTKFVAGWAMEHYFNRKTILNNVQVSCQNVTNPSLPSIVTYESTAARAKYRILLISSSWQMLMLLYVNLS